MTLDEPPGVAVSQRRLPAAHRRLDVARQGECHVLAPRPGNDFLTRHHEDLPLLADIGVRAVQLGIDWARLEPTQGDIDDDWREWYHDVLDSAARAGVAVWATLHERTVPRWFDDAGSFGDERAAGRFWPRWVERCADLFGDRVAGWFPIHDPVGAASPWLADPPRRSGPR